MKKLKQHTGETLAEVLIAVLVMVTAFVILTGAVVSAARINDRALAKHNYNLVDVELDFRV